MLKRIVLFLVMLTVLASGLFSQANPFLSKSDSETELEGDLAIEAVGEQVNNAAGSSRWFTNSWLYRQIVRIQSVLHKTLSDFFLDLRKNPNGSTTLFLLAFSFLYGVIHALGPGHRKTILISYFLSREATVRTGILTGLGFGVLHGGSAVVLIGILNIVLQRVTMNSVEETRLAVEKYGLMVMLGVGGVMLLLKFFEIVRGHHHEHEGSEIGDGHHQAIHNHSGRNVSTVNVRSKLYLPFIVISGSVPCPGSILILTSAMAFGLFAYGLLAVAALSLGMALTLVVFSVGTIITKKSMFLAFGKSEKMAHFLHEAGEIAGSVLIILFALIMLLPILMV